MKSTKEDARQAEEVLRTARLLKKAAEKRVETLYGRFAEEMPEEFAAYVAARDSLANVSAAEKDAETKLRETILSYGESTLNVTIVRSSEIVIDDHATAISSLASLEIPHEVSIKVKLGDLKGRNPEGLHINTIPSTRIASDGNWKNW
jgi:hypothetical protein